MRKGLDYVGTGVVFMCHDGNGEYLLNKRSSNCRDEQGVWDCGGGGIDLHDAVEDTLAREIREEYGARMLEHEFLGYRDVHRVHDGEKTHWVMLDFKVRISREEARNGEPHKFDDIGWFRIGEFPEPLHSQFPHFLAKYKGRLT